MGDDDHGNDSYEGHGHDNRMTILFGHDKNPRSKKYMQMQFETAEIRSVLKYIHKDKGYEQY